MPAFRTTLITSSIVALSVLSLTLSGCKSTNSGSAGSGSGAGAAGGGSTEGSTAAGAATPAAAAPAGGKLDATSCPSVAVVMSNLHLSDLTLEGDDPSTSCIYIHGADPSAAQVVIILTPAPGVTAAVIQSGLQSNDSDVQAVSGIGDAAYTFTGKSDGTTGITVLSAGVVVSIAVNAQISTAAEEALAKAIIGG